MMKESKLIIFFSLLILTILSCDANDSANSQKKDQLCQSYVEEFLESHGLIDYSSLIGLSTAVRGENKEGLRLVRPIEFTSIDKSKYRIPSISGTTYKSNGSIELSALATIMNLDSVNYNNDLRKIYTKIEDVFNATKVVQISSQRHLGDYIEFQFFSGCSIWYKKPKAYLSAKSIKAFEKAKIVAPNWYIIELSTDAPVLKKMPDNIEINE